MPKIKTISPDFAVASALAIEDVATFSQQGYRTIIGNLPDGERAMRAPAAEIEAEAARQGLVFIAVPTSQYDVFTDDVVGGMADALARAPKPVLAYCASGMRSSIAWAAAQVRQRPVDEVLASLKTAGLELDFVRDDLESQADKARLANCENATAPKRARKVPAAA